MKKRFFWKGFVLGIIFLFVGFGFINSTLGVIREKTTYNNPISKGYIQGLIDNASEGDIIYIPSGIYNEIIIINKSISLIGVDKNTTIIDGSESGDVVNVSADWVNISGFTIQSTSQSNYRYYAGIYLNSRYSSIENNIITNNFYGIEFTDSNSNNIKDNSFFDNYIGIQFRFSHSNSIIGNSIKSHYDGICFFESDFNTISDNVVDNNDVGIEFSSRSSFNTIKGNNILNNDEGILFIDTFLGSFTMGSTFNLIIKNNFIENGRDAFFRNSRLNRWSRNYWNEARIFPKLIFGELYYTKWTWVSFVEFHIPWIPQIDWRPAQEPYDIEM